MNPTQTRSEQSGNDGARRPVQIMAEINRTRADMDQTLSAIEQRLTPGQLVDQGLDYLKHSGAREYAANLGSSVKTNPMPVTLAAIGIAWMMATSKREPSASGASSGPGMGERMQSAKDSLQSTKNSVTSGMQSTKDSLASGVQSAKQTLTGGMQSARERASQLGDTAGRQIDRARDNWDYVLRENPLVLGAVGLAIGALAAALAPRTRTEDEMMGQARDNLMDQAKRAGTAKLEEAKQMASATVNTVKDAAADTVKRKTESADPTKRPSESAAQGERSKFSPPGKQQDWKGDGATPPPQGASSPKPSAQEKFEDSSKWPPSARR
jgi:ElaB/YqjD/DUF883 family membrane-anchored ribosome-binding protein